MRGEDGLLVHTIAGVAAVLLMAQQMRFRMPVRMVRAIHTEAMQYLLLFGTAYGITTRITSSLIAIAFYALLKNVLFDPATDVRIEERTAMAKGEASRPAARAADGEAADGEAADGEAADGEAADGEARAPERKADDKPPPAATARASKLDTDGPYAVACTRA